MLNEQTMTKLYAMKLNGLAAGYEEQRQQPRMADLSFDERLGLLVDRQWRWREERSLKMRLHNAKFKFHACIEDVDYRASRGLKRAQIDQLSSSEWVGFHQNLILTGPTGTGKTFLACALGQKACRDGHRVRYYVAAKLFRELSQAHADGSFMSLSSKLLKTDLLLIDDWGLETLKESQYRDFLELLDARQGSPVSSQRSFGMTPLVIPPSPMPSSTACSTRLTASISRVRPYANPEVRPNDPSQIPAAFAAGSAGTPKGGREKTTSSRLESGLRLGQDDTQTLDSYRTLS